jgi:L-alanine-DL-glutamate epimerase-like enolase superfamily enzyme
MRLDRRHFLSALAAAPVAAATTEKRVIPWWEEPVADFRKAVPNAVTVESIELLKNGSNFFVRARSTDGVVGVCRTKQMEDYIPIFERHVAPKLIGKDARDLDFLIDQIYTAQYKLAGQPFWCPVAYAEQALLDLLGRSAKKPVGALFGKVIREEIPVYLSGSGRETTAEQEVDVYVKGIEETGAKAVKFKIGGRMSRNLDAYPGRTSTMLPLARKRLGDRIIINADANGSYNAEKAIEVGRMLEDLKYNFFEEPCPWEELGETKKVADALTMPVAIGEQDASLWRFIWMCENEVAQIVQPDINYVGGLIRAMKVARIAKKFNRPIVPHNTQTGSTSVNILQFASVVENIGGYMEYPHRGDEKPESYSSPQFVIRNGTVPVPKTPGLGVEFDPAYLAKAQVVVSQSAKG